MNAVSRSAAVSGPVPGVCVLPIYWMVNMSFKTNEEILGFTLWPQHFTWANYAPSSPTRAGTRATSTA
jgi:ABC-type glycerol-3-phosphate transport system permease component